MKDLWGDDIPEEEPEVKVKKLGIFDFFTDITDSKVNLMKGLSEEHHDVYEPYKMNKFLSQSADVEVVHLSQQLWVFIHNKINISV